MDKDRIEGQAKQAEGTVQEAWGKLKDEARGALDRLEDALDSDGEDERDEGRSKRAS